MSEILSSQMSSDLNIKRFELESELEYGNRLIYSGLAEWARVQVLGKSYTDISNDTEFDYHNVDIMHIQTCLSKVTYGMLNILPHSCEWLKDNNIEAASNEIASVIIKQLIFCYELTKLDNRRLTNSPKQIISFGENKLIKGDTSLQEKYLHSVGLGRWSCDTRAISNYKETLNIPSLSNSQYYYSLIDDAIWKESKLNGIYQIFKVGSRGWYANAWVDFDKSTIPDGVSLIRNMETDGGYFLINKVGDEVLTAKLDKWYYDEKEIYRIMYVLNEINKTKAVFKVKNNTDHLLLHCNSRLPNAEMRIILMSSWPQRSYNDVFYRIVPMFLWKDVKQCLNDLGIVIKLIN